MVILLSARFATLERENRFGVVDAATLNMERNRINAALSHVIDEFADVNPPPATHKSDVEDSKSPKTVIQNAEKIYNIDRIDNANFS